MFRNWLKLNIRLDVEQQKPIIDFIINALIIEQRTKWITNIQVGYYIPVFAL